jgi:hypothetical protein
MFVSRGAAGLLKCDRRRRLKLRLFGDRFSSGAAP